MGTSRSHRWSRLAIAALSSLAACSAVAYQPCPVDLGEVPEAVAYEVAAQLLRARFGGLEVADPDGCRLQTGWVADEANVAWRRVTVFRAPPGLGVLVEQRTLIEPLLGLPYWSPVGADPRTERELATELEQELCMPVLR